MNRSEPSAVEFLTTYGWALLAVFIIAAGLVVYTDAVETPADGENATAEGPDVAVDGLLEDLERIVLPEDGVVCYRYTGRYKGGLSCLPLNATDVEVRGE